MEIHNMFTLYQQLERINQTYSNWKGYVKYRKVLYLKGVVKPTVISPEYIIKITYIQGEKPKIYVLSPNLEIHPKKEKLPHIWFDTGSLCLDLNEYNIKSDLLAESIIVWVTWWLYYYEIWLQTGRWVAKGTHPDKW